MLELEPSDITLIIDALLAVFLAGYFALGRPRAWFRDRLGWVIFGYALAVVALLALIVYDIVFGQKVDEPVRFVVGAALGVALVAKTRAIHNERRAGRNPGIRLGATGKAVTMTNSNTPATEAPVIWYKGKRVVRTIVQALVVLIPLVNLIAVAVIGYLNEQTSIVVAPVVFVWLNAIVALTAFVMGLVARLMAVPGVNDLLVKIGLGSVPASAIEAPGVVARDPNTR